MSRLLFALVTSLAVPAGVAAQQVPGRDLFEFPIGILADAPPLSREIVGGLWNPATSALRTGERVAAGAAALTTPIEEGVQATLLSTAYRFRSGLTGSLSMAQVSVGGILRTETDPQSLDEVPYTTSLFSAGMATETHGATFGVAARYRSGVVDTQHGQVLTMDGGMVIDRVAGTPVRLAASTFLFSPWRRQEDATYLLAADIPLVRADSVRSLRGGYSIQHTDERGQEGYAFVAARYRQFNASAGLLQSDMFGSVSRRARFGVELRYGRYGVAVAREDGAAGLSSSYQFLLTSIFP